MRQIVFNILFICLLPICLLGQGDVSFVGKSNAKQVTMGNHFQVMFTLNNANGTDFKPPAFQHFKRISGQNVSSQSSNYNGQWQTAVTYSFFLQPKKLGKYQVGAASIKVDGKTYKTKPFLVEVVQGRANNQINAEEKIFVRAEVNTTEVVPGEQIILDYKVYTAIDVEHYNIVEEPSYSGFYTSQIRRFDAARMNEVVNGVQYTTQILKRIALYPQQTGSTTIEPMRFRVAIPLSNGRQSTNNIYSLIRPTETFILTSNSVDITVNPLPSPVPDSYSGAVGRYEATASLDKLAATTDDAITLRFTVTGDGDIQRVTAPNLILSDSFEVYDPNVVDEQQLERNGELYGIKAFEYLILPKVPGTFNISPEFSYYDPDSSKFVITYPNNYVVNVMKGQYNTNVNVKPEVQERPKEEIRYIKTAARTHHRSDFVGSALFWGLLVFPFLLLGLAVLYKYIKANQPEVDWVAEKSKRAQKVAKQRLANAEKYLKAGDNRSFYDETSKVLLGYASDKFNIPRSELSKNNVKEKLTLSGAQSDHIDRFMALLKTCEKAIFAFGVEGDAQKTYNEAVSVISDIEM